MIKLRCLGASLFGFIVLFLVVAIAAVDHLRPKIQIIFKKRSKKTYCCCLILLKHRLWNWLLIDDLNFTTFVRPENLPELSVAL